VDHLIVKRRGCGEPLDCLVGGEEYRLNRRKCTPVQMVYHGAGRQVIARSVQGVDDGVGYGISGKKGNGLDEAI